MDAILPSYEAATARDPLPLIAPYLRRQDLLRASLVCRRWHSAFSRFMWTSPERLWEMGERSSLTGFLLFLRSLSRLLEGSRPYTTHHTSSFSLHTVSSSIYTSLPPEWLHLLLSNLPSLQSLNVSNFSYFDQDCLRYLTQQSPPLCTYSLKALMAQGCHNLTSFGVEGLLEMGWPDLEDLDLSSSCGVNQPKVFMTISNEASLPSLKRLALRNLELKDTAIEILAKGLGTRIRELDIRENLVSDVGVEFLLNYCFLPPEYDVHPGLAAAAAQMEGYYTGPPPPPFHKDGNASLNARKGLTHLLISKNPKIHWTSIEYLIKTTRLECFDCGTVADFDLLSAHSRKRLPLPILSMYAHKNLVSLRIDFRLIAPMAWKVVTSPQVMERPMEEELRLKPTMLPNLKKLVLCGVPYYSVSSFRVTEGLSQFLDDLGDTEAEAEAEMRTQSGDVGNSRCTHSFGSATAHKLRYLQLLVLEMQALTVTEDERDRGIGMYGSSSSGRPRRRKSDSNSEQDEDDDGDDEDKLAGDFSFFTEGGEEGSGGWWSSTVHTSGNADPTPGVDVKKGKGKETQVNVLAELATLREAGRKGMRKFWSGKVKVVKDMGWDDAGGVEGGRKWGVVEDLV